MKRVIVIIKSDYADRIDIAKKLVELGLEVTDMLPSTGVIIGKFESENFSPLLLVDGVQSVEKELKDAVEVIPVIENAPTHVIVPVEEWSELVKASEDEDLKCVKKVVDKIVKEIK